MSGPKDYIEVKDRIQLFLEQYPEGSLQGSWEHVEIAGESLIVYTARAYRHPEDTRPGIGTASEPFPGKTNFTRGSELANAETSSWGRAIVALGIAAHKGVASAQDVRKSQVENRQAPQIEASPADRPKPLTSEQKVTIDLEVEARELSDLQLVEAMCAAVEVDVPNLDDAGAAKWAAKGLDRFPEERYAALLELVKRHPSREV
jgi:hypothetical protein